MPVDYKTAKHSCNVIRRLVQDSFPGLYIHFVPHPHKTRDEYYKRDVHILHEHSTGKDLANHIEEVENTGVLMENSAAFTHMAYRLETGLFGLRDKNSYYALCFINIDHFDTDEDFKTHAYNLAWHALSARRKVQEYSKTSEKITAEDGFTHESNILTVHKTPKQLAHDNFMADLFSAVAQTITDKENAVSAVAMQRITKTLVPTYGFRAHLFPFPICVDTVQMIIEGKRKYIRKTLKTIAAAQQLTLNVAETYDDDFVDRWWSFSLPAQEMAWSGQTPATILGSAIYTSGKPDIQSTADLLAEYAGIRPDVITSLRGYNPYDKDDVNEKMHKNMGNVAIDEILRKLKTLYDIELLIDAAVESQERLMTGNVMGWCSHALLTAAQTIQESEDELVLMETLDKARARFIEAFNSVPLKHLILFSKHLQSKKQNGETPHLEEMIYEIRKNENMSDLYKAIERYDETLKAITKREQEKNADMMNKKNISDFISPNAIK